MKRKRTTKNSLKSPYSLSQYSISTAKDYDDDDDASYSYLHDECWELIYKFLIQDGNGDKHANSLSLVNKQLLSITNRLRLSVTIRGTSTSNYSYSFLKKQFRRFTNLNSLDLTCYKGNLNTLLSHISRFPFKLTSLYISNQPKIPREGLLTFSGTITTLTSLTCSYIPSLSSIDLLFIARYFPNLLHLDLSHCDGISEQGILHILKICSNITHLNLSGCSDLKLINYMDFQALNLEVLNLSYSTVDNHTLYVFSRTCPRLLQLLLNNCLNVTYAGVAQVIYYCRQLKEIDLSCCQSALGVNVYVVLLLNLSSSLKKITLPHNYIFKDEIEIEVERLARRQGCIVSRSFC